MTAALGYVVLGRTGPGAPWFVDDDPELIEDRAAADVVLARLDQDAADPDGLTEGWQHQLAVVVEADRWVRYERVCNAILASRRTWSALAIEATKVQPKPDAVEQERLLAACQEAGAELTAAVNAIDPEVTR